MTRMLAAIFGLLTAAPMAAQTPPDAWRDALKDAALLNNLVWELARHESGDNQALPTRFTFTLPVDRWIFIRSQATIGADSGLWLTLDDDSTVDAVIAHKPATQNPLETMRYLSAGEHTLHLHPFGQVTLSELVIRAIPAIDHGHYHSQPELSNFGPFDWAFLSRHVLPHVNTMSSRAYGPLPPEIAEWRKSGRKWIAYTGRTTPEIEKSIDETVKYYAGSHGMAHPLMDGILVDEFYAATDAYDEYRQVVHRLRTNPRFAGKAFHPYIQAPFGDFKEPALAFARECMASGGYLGMQAYLFESTQLKELQRGLEWLYTAKFQPLEQHLPGTIDRVTCVFASFSDPWPWAAGFPEVNFNVQLDLQFQWLATHPKMFGIGGVQTWHSGYHSEETMRLVGQLYRHYCIEGKTQRLLDDPYELTHVRNPDFTDKLNGWQVAPAPQGGINAREHEGYGKLQGRYRAGNDTFAWMKRSAAAPNRISQTIQDLEPGRLYAMKMFVGDYQDMINGVTVDKSHAYHVRLDGVEPSDEPKRSFRNRFPTRLAVDKFDRNHPFMLGYYWQVFLAKATTAELVISDWMSDDETGGAAGEELMFNFIEVRPFYGE